MTEEPNLRMQLAAANTCISDLQKTIKELRTDSINDSLLKIGEAIQKHAERDKTMTKHHAINPSDAGTHSKKINGDAKVFNWHDPESPDPTNTDRAAVAIKGLEQYILEKYGEDDGTAEERLTDFLADLMHMAAYAGIDFENCLRIAEGHFEAEERGE